MASYNPYRLDPNIAQGFSNLTRALIGSAQDDADIARAGLLNEQARGVGLDNTGKQNYMKARNTALDDASIVSAMFDTFGLKEPRINKDFDPSVSMAQAPAEAYGQFSSDGMRGLVEAMLFGEGGTANQTAQAAALMRGMAQSEEGRDQIRNSGESLARQAMMMQGVNPTKWLEGDHVQTDLANTFMAELDKNAKVLEGKLNQNQLELEASQYDSEQDAKAEVKSSEITADAKKAYENFRTDKNAEVEQEKNQLIYGPDGSEDRKAELDDKFKRWKHENREIEMSVEAGKKLVLDPETGARLGLEPNEDGLYVLDGGKDATKVAVKVGKEDVYLSKEHAEELGIEKNAEGLYVIPGAGYESDGSSSKSGKSDLKGMLESRKKFMEVFTNEVNTNNEKLKTQLSRTALGGMMLLGEESMKDNVESGNMTLEEAYREFVTKPIQQGAIMFEKEGGFFTGYRGEDKAFPKYWFDHFVDALNQSGEKTDVVTQEIRKDITKSFGYSSEDADQLMILLEKRAKELSQGDN